MLVDEIDELISSGSKDELEKLAAGIAAGFDNLMRKAPENAANVAQGRFANESSEAYAYVLGKLALAHAVVSQVGAQRASTQSLDLLRKSNLQPYFKALSKREMTGVELSEALNLKPETVSRNLSILRQYGLVDCRRDGTRFYNFLTPTAQDAMESNEDSKPLQSIASKLSPRDRAIQKHRRQTTDRFSERRVLTIYPRLNHTA